MSTRIEAVETYGFAATDRLFLDANVWLPIYAPRYSGTKVEKVYSDVLKRVMIAGAEIYADVLIFSEFINRWSRFEYDLVKDRTSLNYKQFRESAFFPPIAGAIAAGCRKIVKLCKRTGSCLETVDIEAIFTEFSAGGYDFNDQMIREICVVNGLTLVTHDGDYADSGLHVLTANRRMLPPKV